MTAEGRPIVLAAGGTGGHIFPAEALAEELLRRNERVVLVTDKRFAGYSCGALAGVETHAIAAGGLRGGVMGKMSSAFKIAFGVLQARRKLSRLRPAAVVGFGGYPSFPTVLSAARMGIPAVIHEQNSVLGRANRLLAPRVAVVATSFPQTQLLREQDMAKVRMTGNPVRAAVSAIHFVPYPVLADGGMMRILVTGGSQGASVFGQVIPAALAALPSVLRTRIRIDQQCRPGDLEVTRAAYEAIGVSADLATFFTDIPARLASCHLVIARAGASTVAELSAAGRPAILVPLPGAMDNHQHLNASAFEHAGAGWLMPQDGFTAAALAARLEALLSLPATLQAAAERARMSGRIGAARELADVVMELIDQGNGGRRTPVGEKIKNKAA